MQHISFTAYQSAVPEQRAWKGARCCPAVLVFLALQLQFGCAASDAQRKTEAPVAQTTGAKEESGTAVNALSLERIFQDPPLSGTSPRGLKFSPDGSRLAMLQPSKDDSEVLDLYAIALGKPGSKSEPLVTTKSLLGERDIKLSEEERMANERKRVRHKGITDYQWCGKDGQKILVPLSGDLYLVSLTSADPEVQKLEASKETRLNPKCSPKGSWVSYVQDGNVFILPTTGGKPRQVTKGATATRKFGIAEFVAQEEMGRYEGVYWSPDEKTLGILEVDESMVAVKVRPRIFADRTEMFEQRYPAAGEKNAEVRLWVADLSRPQRPALRRLTIPKQEESKDSGYIARVAFAPDNAIVVQWQNRAQTELHVYRGAAEQKHKLLWWLDESDEAWVELSPSPHFMPDGTMIWRGGVASLMRVPTEKPVGAVVGPVLKNDKGPILDVVGLDKERIFYVRGTNRSLERHLYSAKIDGSDERQETKKAGTHSVVMNKTCTAYVDTFSTLMTPPVVTLRRIGQDKEQTIGAGPNDASTSEWRDMPKPDFIFAEITAADGKTVLNGLLLRPTGLADGEKAPVMTYVYGGPHAQIVRDAWSRHMPFYTAMTQAGYGIFIVDNRGSGNRNHEFTRSIKNRFGDIEVEDQIAGNAWLKKQAWVDGERVGVFGWSYGGTMAAFLILQEDTPFAAAVSVAPVTDWSLYDTHYTERYIGTPADNAAVYEKASVVRLAPNLKKPLLLMHGMADDNVLFENSLQLVEAFQKNSLPFSFMAYPGRAHGLRGRETQLHVFRMVKEHFDRHLKEDTAASK